MPDRDGIAAIVRVERRGAGPEGLVVGPTEGASREIWLDWRRDGIGGSDAAAIAGLSQWGNPFTVWLDKTRQSGHEDQGSPAMRWGTLLEEVVCQAFADENGAKISHRGAWVENISEPWRRATLDGLAVVDGVTGVLEAKTGNGRDGAWDDGVPYYYQVQVQHQLAVTGLDGGWVAVLLGGQDFRVYEVERDEEAINTLMTIERKFWTENILGNLPPSVGSGKAVNEALREVYGRVGRPAVELPTEALTIVRRLALAKEMAKAAKEQEMSASSELMAMLGDAEIGTVGGTEVVTWKEAKSKIVDVTRLRREMPDVADQYTKESTSRTLRLVNRRDEDG